MKHSTHTALSRLVALSCLLPAASLAQTAPEPATRLETVKVTAPAFDADAARQESSSAKIIVSREDLEKLDAATVSEILRRLPGGVTINEGRRGRHSQPDRLEPRIVVDGDALPGGNRMALRLPVELIERIEIIKNSTAEFPSGAGGTINLILRDVPPKKTGTYRFGVLYNDDALGARVGGVYGDKEGEKGELWMLFANSRPVSSARTLSSQHFTTAGVRDDWDIESDSETGRDNALYFITRLTRDLGQGTRLVISPFLLASERNRTTVTQKTTYSDPATGSGPTGNGIEREHEQAQRINGRLAADWKRRHPPGGGDSSARISLQSESESRTSDLDSIDALGTASHTQTRTTSRALELSLTAKRSLPLANVHLATFGLEARAKNLEETKRQIKEGTPQPLNAQASADTREHLLALWAQDEWQVSERNLLTPGLRLQRTLGRVTDALDTTVSGSHTAWLPSLHHLWQINPGWNIRSSLAWSDKPPAARDLSPVIQTATGANSLSNPDRAGNPSLAVERTATLQLGVEHFLPQKRGSAGLNLYLRQIDDKLQQVIQPETLPGPEVRYVERPANVGRAHETSVVADFKFQPAALPALTLRGNASTSQLTLNDSSMLPRQESPRHNGNLGVDYEHAPWKTTLGGNLSLTASSTRGVNATTQLTQRARQQLDLYAVKKIGKKLSLRLTIDNVTREGQDSESLELSGGSLVNREDDRARGVRTYYLSLEGKL